jgi:hypothetical protein
MKEQSKYNNNKNKKHKQNPIFLINTLSIIPTWSEIVLWLKFLYSPDKFCYRNEACNRSFLKQYEVNWFINRFMEKKNVNGFGWMSVWYKNIHLCNDVGTLNLKELKFVIVILK